MLAGDIDFGNLASSLRNKLTDVESQIADSLNLAPLMPVVGQQIGNVAQIVSDTGSSLADVFQSIGLPASDPGAEDAVRQALLSQSFVGDYIPGGGKDVLVQKNADGSWQFEILLQQSGLLSTLHPQFAIGLGDYFTLQQTGSIDLNLDLDYELKFTFDGSGTLALQSASLAQFPNQDLALTVATPMGAGGLSGLQLDGTLAALLHIQGSLSADSFFSSTLLADVNPNLQTSASFSADSHIGVAGMSLDFGPVGLPFNPRITGGFHFDWHLDNQLLAAGLSADSFGVLSNVQFDALVFQADSLFGDGGFVRTVVEDVQAFTKPIQPIVDFALTNIPGLSDLGVDFSVADLLEQVSPGSRDFLELINYVNTLDVDQLNSGDIPITDAFTLDANGLRQAGKTQWDGNGAPLVHPALGTYSQLDFPLLEDPAGTVFQMLTGHDNVTLFQFQVGLNVPLDLPPIPLFGIPPFAGLFLHPSAAFNLSFGFGYDTSGLRAAVNDPDHVFEHVLDGFYIDNTKSVVQDQKGNNYDHYATSIDVMGGLDLEARAAILLVSGGLHADVNLHLDPNLNDAQQRVRLSALEQQIEHGDNPFSAGGSLYITADLSVIIPTFWGDITLAHVNLGHLNIVDFGGTENGPPTSDGHTIYVHKSATNEKIYVRMTQFSAPDPEDPKAYTKAILVEYPDHKEVFPVAHYFHDPVLGDLIAHIADYDLIATDRAYHFDNSFPPQLVQDEEVGDQTIIVDDLTWEGQDFPVNAVLIGGSGNDALEYQGAGRAILIGAGGDDILQSTNPNAASVTAFGDRIDVGQTGYIDYSGLPPEVVGLINAQVSQAGEPLMHGPHGDFLSAADAHDILIGGIGTNLLEGGSSTTFIGGPTINEYKVALKYSTDNPEQGHVLTNGGTRNTVLFERTDVPNNDDDSLVLRPFGTNLLVTGKRTNIVVDHSQLLGLNLNGGTLDIGDLSSLGNVQIVGNLAPTRVSPTHVVMDTPTTPVPDTMFVNRHLFTLVDANGVPILNDQGESTTYYDLDVLQGAYGNQPGANLELVGLDPDEDLLLKLHGGQVQVNNLSGVGIGRVTVDGTVRPVDSTNVNIVGIEVHNGNDNFYPDTDGGVTIRMEDAAPPYRVQILGNRLQDTTTFSQTVAFVNGNDPVAGKLLTFDASTLLGALEIHAQEDMVLSATNNQLTTSLFEDPVRHVTIGDGRLARIHGNVSVSHGHLTINNALENGPAIYPGDVINPYPGQNLLWLNPTTFYGWAVPGLAQLPTLTYDVLDGALSVQLGEGDRISLDGTPSGVTSSAVSNSWLETRDAIFSPNWSVPLDIYNNFGVYLGRRLDPITGAEERVKHLISLAIPVHVYHAGTPLAEVILDGDLDPPDAQYVIDGMGNLHVLNQTVGLDLTVDGYRAEDQIYIYLPGGSVDANLRKTGPGIFYVDGKARLAGTNPSAPNDISALVRAGDISLDPIGTNDSVLHAYNTLYVLGSIPEDSLSVTAPTLFKVAPTQQGDAQIELGAFGFVADPPKPYEPYAGSFGTYYANPAPTDFFAVLSTEFVPTTGHGEPPILVGNGLTGVDFIDNVGLTYSAFVVPPGGTPVYLGSEYAKTATVRIFPSNPNPTTTDNNVNLDASQLRGDLAFNVEEPDYATAKALMDAFGSLHTGAIATFGQTSVNLTKVNPELAVTVTGTPPIFSSDLAHLLAAGSVVHHAGTSMTVGTGRLADIQGDVNAYLVWLKDIDDRQGTSPDNLTLTSRTLSGWSTDAGTHPTMTFDLLEGDFTISASPLDQFDVEGTPNTAPTTTIRNFVDTGTPSGVYVMGKSVMPLYVTGNFALYVGRRLNSDGSIDVVGHVADVFDSQDRYEQTGGLITDYSNVGWILRDLALQPAFTQVVVPPLTLIHYVNSYETQKPLPVFLDFTGHGQATLVFDTSDETTSDQNLGSTIDGIWSNPNFPGMGDLRYLASGDVLYGANTEVYFYGPVEIGNPMALSKPGPTVLINNPLSSPVHYISNPNNRYGVEEILIGSAQGPIDVQGNGLGTRVEINPLFSFPIQPGSSSVLPGWGDDSVGAYSLLDTIQADVSVSQASLRVIADIPLPTGIQDHTDVTPDVELTATQLTGIAAAPIHFFDLIDAPSTANSGNFRTTLDLEVTQLPGLSIQLPSHVAVATTVSNTPAGATTVISTLLSDSDTSFTAGPVVVAGTTGPLVLGQLFSALLTGGVQFNWSTATGQPTGHLSWDDGWSVPQLTLGSAGSVQGLDGPVLLAGDSHLNSATVTTIDGSAESSRQQVSFTAHTYSAAPYSIVTSTHNEYYSALAFYKELNNFAPAPIYFSTFYNRAHNLSVRGSAMSSYDVAAAPPTMNLYAGAASTVANSSAPINIIGAWNVALMPTQYAAIPGLSGAPQINISEDPSQPHAIELSVDKTPVGTPFPTTPAGTLYLDPIQNDQLSLRLQSGSTVYWDVRYAGDNTHVAINFGPIVVSDTGMAGTVLGAGTQQIDVYGTSGPLQINPGGQPTGTQRTEIVNLGQAGNMQAIRGAVDIYSNDPTKGYIGLTLDNSSDTVGRNIDLQANGNGNALVSGMAPGPITLIGTRFSTSFRGGAGGNVFHVMSLPNGFYYSIRGAGLADTLIGPDQPNTWNIYQDTSASNLDGTAVSYQSIGNLQGGADADTFSFVNGFYNAGVVHGNVDGGAGIDSLYYGSSTFWHNVPFDLANGVAPRIEGLTSNVEIVPIDWIGPGSQTRQVGANIAPLQIQILGGLGTFTFAATGLPTGLSIDTQTGVISGSMAEAAANASPYQISVSVTDGYNATSGSFALTVLPGIVVVDPGPQSATAGSAATLAIQSTSIYGQPLTYSATGLPAGLSIDPQSGLISGTISVDAAGGSPYTVEVSASDGARSGSASFVWSVLPSFSLVNPGNQLTPEGVPISLAMQVLNPNNQTLSFSAAGLPSYLYIDQNTGVIGGSIYFYHAYYGYDPTFSVTVYATDGASTVSTSFNWTTEPGFGVYVPGDQSSFVGDTVYAYAGVSNNPYGHSFTYAADGLPPGLTFDPGSHSINGTIDAYADANSPYHATVTVTDQTINFVYPISFQWSVAPTIILDTPADQATPVGTAVDLPITLQRDLGLPITFSASGLPLGLDIDPATGHIVGTVAPQSSLPGQFYVTIHADDGLHASDRTFEWTVTASASNVLQLADTIHGGYVTLESRAGTTLSASLSSPGYYDSAAVLDFALGQIQFQIEGLTPGEATELSITPPAGRDWTDYREYGTTPAHPDNYDWYNFLYQHQTDDNDASTTGAEFLPNGQIILHLVDGGRGDDDLATDGVIQAGSGGGPTQTELAVHIAGAPSGGWPIDAPVTLTAQLDGALAPGASFNWQVSTYTSAYQYIVVATGNQSTITFMPGPTGVGYFNVSLTATSADGQVSANDYLDLPEPTATVTNTPLSQIKVSGFASDVTAGQMVSGGLAAEDGSGNLIADSADAVTAELVDNQGNVVFSVLGNFAAGAFTLPAHVLNNPGTSPITDMLTVTSGAVSTQLPIVVHPITRFGGTADTPTVADVGQPFDVTLQAEDDRGVFAPGYTGAVELSYVDTSGTSHVLGGGTQTAIDGRVTFTNVVLPSLGNYALLARSTDGHLNGQFLVTVPVASRFEATAASPTVVYVGQTFDFGIRALDADGQPLPDYTGLIALSTSRPIATSADTAAVITPVDLGQHTFQGLSFDSAGDQTLTIRDGVVETNFPLGVLAVNFSFQTIPQNIQSGVPFDLTVTARNDQGGVLTSYLGSVSVAAVNEDTGEYFNLSNGAINVLASDAGVLTFQGLMLPVAGHYSLFIYDNWNQSAYEFEVTSPPVGDVDGNGLVDAQDIDYLFFLVGNHNPAADLNGDGLSDHGDVDYLVHTILGTEYGDANLDRHVDAADLATVRTSTGGNFGGPNWVAGDFNGDGFVDAADLATVRKYIGFSAPVGEPSLGSAEPDDPGLLVAAPIVAVSDPVFDASVGGTGFPSDDTNAMDADTSIPASAVAQPGSMTRDNARDDSVGQPDEEPSRGVVSPGYQPTLAENAMPVLTTVRMLFNTAFPDNATTTSPLEKHSSAIRAKLVAEPASDGSTRVDATPPLANPESFWIGSNSLQTIRPVALSTSIPPGDPTILSAAPRRAPLHIWDRVIALSMDSLLDDTTEVCNDAVLETLSTSRWSSAAKTGILAKAPDFRHRNEPEPAVHTGPNKYHAEK